MIRGPRQTLIKAPSLNQRGGSTAIQQHLGTAEYSRLQQIQRNAELVQRTQRWYSAHSTNTAHYSTSTAQLATNTALYSTVQLPSTAAYSSTPVQQASFMCVQCTAQIQHKYSTNTAQIQHKYSTNTAQMQHKYSTHAIRIQLEFSSIYFTQKGRKRQEELESGIRA